MTTDSRLAHNLASGHGIATLSGSVVLDVWFPAPSLGPLVGEPLSILKDCVGKDPIRKVSRELISREIDLTSAPTDAIDAYLRLHLLSHR